MITEKEKIDYQKRDIKYLEEVFLMHCKCENFQGIEYLLMSPDLEENVDIHTRNDWALIIACTAGKIKLVQYLLTSPELKEHADIHSRYYYGLSSACSNGHLEIVRYLLTSPELKEHADIHARDDKTFINAYKHEHKEIVQYLIFDYYIEITEDINNYIEDKPDLIKLFEIRDLNNKLNGKLINKNGVFTNKNIKI